MASKGRIDDIVDVPAIKKQIDYLKEELDAINDKLGKYATTIVEVNKNIKSSKAMGELSESIKKNTVLLDEATQTQKKHVDVSAKLATETARLNSLNNGGAAAEVELLKIKQQRIAREKELLQQAKDAINSGNKQTKSIDEQIAAVKRQVSTIRAIEEETKKLGQIKKDIILVEGKQSDKIREINSMIDKNTAILRLNGDAATKQRMNIGNYGSAMDGVKSAARNLMGALGLTAGLAGAVKLVQGVIASTEGTADEFEMTLSGLKEQAQFVARAFANFDFSNFIEGLREANKEGRRYAETLDLIEDLQRANQLQENDIERQIINQRIIAKNKSNELSVREAAIKEIIRLEELKLTNIQAITKKGIENELENSASRTKISKAEISEFVQNYGLYADKVSEGRAIIAKVAEESKLAGSTIFGQLTGAQARAFDKVYATLTESQKESIRLAKLENSLTTDKRKLLVAAVDADQKANIELSKSKEGLVRLENSLRSELLKTENENNNYTGAVTKRVSAVQKLTDRIDELKDEMYGLKDAEKPIPDSMIHELISSEAKLERIKKEVEAIADGLVAIKSKEVSVVVSTSKTAKPSILKPRASVGSGGAEANAGMEDKLFTDQEIRDLAIDSAQQTADATFAIIQASSDAEFDYKMSLLDKQREAELANKNLTEAQKAAINEKYAKKEAQLKEKQFKKQKAADVIQSIINTALAVTKLLGQPALAVAAGIAGAAQTAVIEAQPIPKYFKGRDGGPAEFAYVHPGEAVEIGNKLFPTPNKETLTFLPAGASVIPQKDLMRMTENVNFEMPPTTDVGISKSDFIRLNSEIANLQSGFEMLAATIKNKKELHLSMTEQGWRSFVQNGASQIEYINKNIRF